ncbi:hypothetical protein DFA_00500 [Cavenderia fasciculata]|uniref:Phosphagen kinase N-terminal domain-containing protein n=1 Tax=Cavenderia fasciculata TaxID=261658 RepID=F4PS93_CACFS|nr:uncharacterized protein DFA_00500 [Cavenderia fasciculata]EGG20639.1 hypothetical protein DFA_00500 [Cavenderia fasciculata]|eukprot:XP_004358489.1 hypothetical protein DFA_00500 [Cavenderia fasciculata]
MEKPSEDFIDLVIILAREDQLKERRRGAFDTGKYISRRERKLALKDCCKSSPDGVDRVVSWLLYLMGKATFVVQIKEKSVQLLNGLIEKLDDDVFIERLSDEMVDVVKVETIELLKSTLTDTFRQHLIGIIQLFALYLLPTGRWDTLQQSLEINEHQKEEASSPSSSLLATKNYMRMVKLDMLVKLINSGYFQGRLTDENYRASIPGLLLILSGMDGIVDGKLMVKLVDRLKNIFLDRPSLIEEFIQQIIDTLIKLLDVNSEMGFASKKVKGRVIDYLLFIVENHPLEFTDSHLERIINHLYEWVCQVDGVSLEVWTNRYYNSSNFKNPNIDEEKDIGIISDSHCDDQNQMLVDADLVFLRFMRAVGDRVEELNFHRFSTHLNSQQWNQRYASLISLSTIPKYLSTTKNNIQFILKTLLKLAYDDSIQVRWASLHCLIQLFLEYGPKIFGSREELYRVIRDSVQNSNGRIQSCCCLLIQTIAVSLGNDMITDNDLSEITSSLEILLQSPLVIVVERAMVSLMSIISIFNKRSGPYFDANVTNLIWILKNHQILSKKESRLLRWRAVKAFAMYVQLMDKKTLSQYMDWFMAFVKENQGSLDLGVDVLRLSHLFVHLIGQQSFTEVLSRIFKMIITVLETPLPTRQEDMTESSIQDVNRIVVALKSLYTVLYNDDQSVNEFLAPFIDRLVGSLCQLANCPVSKDIQLCSFRCLPLCVGLVEMQYSSDKKIEMFGMILDCVLILCPLETDWRMLERRVYTVTKLITQTDNDMTLDQIKSTMTMFLELDKRMNKVAQKDILDRSCMILRDIGAADIVKANIIHFMRLFVTKRKYGGEYAVKAFPQIIPTIIECLTIDYTDDVKEYATYALEDIAQLTLDRFSPFAMDALLAIDNMISIPSSSSLEFQEHAISVIGTIIRHVPLTTSNLNDIIPKWFNHLDHIDDKYEIEIIVDDLCAIIHHYPNECLGNEYQHVDKLHQIIEYYITKQQQQELLTDTLTFIKESIKSNWNNVPEEKRDGYYGILKYNTNSIYVLLVKHQVLATKETRLLRSRVIKAFASDWQENVFRASGVFIKEYRQSFAVYLPMIVKNIVQILEAPLPNLQEEMTESSEQHVKRLVLAIKALELSFLNPKSHNDGDSVTPYHPFGRFIHRYHQLIDHHAAITVPLIAQDLLDRSCHKLQDTEESDTAKGSILYFLTEYLQHGGESTINTFPQIIPTLIHFHCVICISIMDRFIEIIVDLVKEDQEKQDETENNRNGNNKRVAARGLFKEYVLSIPDNVVSWLLYLMINGPCTTIKAKTVQLLDRLLIKKGKEFIGSLSEDTLSEAKVKTVELFKTDLTETFRHHLNSIIGIFVTDFIPRGYWVELETAIDSIIKEAGEGSKILENARGLVSLLSKQAVEFKTEIQQNMIKMLKPDVFKSLTDEQKRVGMAMLSSILSDMDEIEERKFILNIINSLKNLKDLPKQSVSSIIDTLIGVLDRNIGKGFKDKDTKRIFIDYFLELIKHYHSIFTGIQVGRIMVHLVEWLTQEEEMVLKDWTDTNSKVDNDYSVYHFNYHQVQKNDIFLEYPVFNNNPDDTLLDKKVEDFVLNLILNQVKKSVEDENSQVRWGSLQCLIRITVEFRNWRIEKREEILQLIERSIQNDRNERNQHRCC